MNLLDVFKPSKFRQGKEIVEYELSFDELERVFRLKGHIKSIHVVGALIKVVTERD